jgi:uncharacterized protein YbjT (DUF2867 family)
MANAGKVLVIGATGTVGSGLVPALRGAGVEVRVFVRDESKAQPLKDVGAEVVVGDLDQPETIEPAVEGVDKIYLLTWNGPNEVQQAESLLKAGERGGNPHIIRHSAWGPEKSRIIKHHDHIEKTVKASNLPWTLLKPTFYMQNTMMAARTIASDGVIYWDMKDGKLAMIDVRDIVDAGVAVLTGSGHEGKSYILTGPEAISFNDVAATLSSALGKDIKYVNVPGEAAVQSMVGMGLPEWIAKGYAELSEGFSEGFANKPTDDVATLTGHPARSFEQFATDFARVFRGGS